VPAHADAENCRISGALWRSKRDFSGLDVASRQYVGYHHQQAAITVLQLKAKRLAAVCASKPRVRITLGKAFNLIILETGQEIGW
jgi:hypothetical protein